MYTDAISTNSKQQYQHIAACIIPSYGETPSRSCSKQNTNIAICVRSVDCLLHIKSRWLDGGVWLICICRSIFTLALAGCLIFREPDLHTIKKCSGIWTRRAAWLIAGENFSFYIFLYHTLTKSYTWIKLTLTTK